MSGNCWKFHVAMNMLCICECAADESDNEDEETATKRIIQQVGVHIRVYAVTARIFLSLGSVPILKDFKAEDVLLLELLKH